MFKVKHEWANDYLTGLDEIDEQHKYFFDLINDLSYAMHGHLGAKKISNVLKELFDYSSSHFAAEEGYMIMSQYPGYNKQQLEHKSFTELLKSHMAEYSKDKTYRHQSTGISLSGTLFRWLVTHIKSLDMQFAKYLKDNGIRIENTIRNISFLDSLKNKL